MNNLETRLVNSIQQLKGKSGKYFTSAMKKWGGGEEGSMVDGLLNIVNMMIEDKRLKVNQTKITYGVGGAAAVGLIWLYTNHKERKRNIRNYHSVVEIAEKEVEVANCDGENAENALDSLESERLD